MSMALPGAKRPALAARSIYASETESFLISAAAAHLVASDGAARGMRRHCAFDGHHRHA